MPKTGQRQTKAPTLVATADAPAGGTGAAAGGWDTANNRNAAITVINNLRADVIAIRQALIDAGIMKS